jgi:hypothetical protein
VVLQRKKHSYGDQPAVIYSNGTKEWYRLGKLHRENDKPAIEHANGIHKWYLTGEVYRYQNFPQVVDTKKNIKYWVDGNGVVTKGEDVGGSILRYKDGFLVYTEKVNIVDKEATNTATPDKVVSQETVPEEGSNTLI